MTDTNPHDTGGPQTGADDERMGARARELFAKELTALVEATPESRRLFERALQSLPLGVASSFQAADPYPIYLSRGLGAEVWDVDGREYVDFHNGFGSTATGHAHPRLVAAIEGAARSGTNSRSRQNRPSDWPRNCVAGSGSSASGSPTPGPKRPWTPYAWRGE